jgi:hypothetical protein
MVEVLLPFESKFSNFLTNHIWGPVYEDEEWMGVIQNIRQFRYCVEEIRREGYPTINYCEFYEMIMYFKDHKVTDFSLSEVYQYVKSRKVHYKRTKCLNLVSYGKS